MRTRRRCPALLLAMVAVIAGVTRAAAKESPSAPPACTPPCQPGETCLGGTCMVPAGRPPAPPPAFPPPATSAPPPAYPPPAYPPPAYPPYAAYRPLPPGGFYEAPLRPVRQRRFLVLPYIGTHSYQNATARDYFPGFRLGSLIGGRVNEQISLNWELTFDISNIDTPPAATSSSEFAFDFAFSPMFHLPAGAAEILLGPKLGVFWVHTDVHNDMTFNDESHQGTGILGGLTVGTFMAVSSTVSLGVLVSVEARKIEHACDVNAGEIALCDRARDSSATLVGLTAAALFR